MTSTEPAEGAPLDAALPAWCLAAREAAIAEQRRRRAARGRSTDEGAEVELWDDVAELLDVPDVEAGHSRCLFLPGGVVFLPSLVERPDPVAIQLYAPAAFVVGGIAALWWGVATERRWLDAVGAVLVALGALAAWGTWITKRPPPPMYTRGVYAAPDALCVSHASSEANVHVRRADVVAAHRKRDFDVSPPAISVLLEIRGRDDHVSVVSRVGERTAALLWMEQWVAGRARHPEHAAPAGTDHARLDSTRG